MQYNLMMTSATASAVFAHESREESRRATSYAWAIVAVWLASTAYAFWSFELRQQRSFEPARSVSFDSGARARLAESWFRENVATGGSASSVATVVHVYTPGCSCDLRGKLVYFGPYSDSARCGDSGGLVERVLDRMLRGEGNTLQPFAASCWTWREDPRD